MWNMYWLVNPTALSFRYTPFVVDWVKSEAPISFRSSSWPKFVISLLPAIYQCGRGRGIECFLKQHQTDLENVVLDSFSTNTSSIEIILLKYTKSNHSGRECPAEVPLFFLPSFCCVKNLRWKKQIAGTISLWKLWSWVAFFKLVGM